MNILSKFTRVSTAYNSEEKNCNMFLNLLKSLAIAKYTTHFRTLLINFQYFNTEATVIYKLLCMLLIVVSN